MLARNTVAHFASSATEFPMRNPKQWYEASTVKMTRTVAAGRIPGPSGIELRRGTPGPSGLPDQQPGDEEPGNHEEDVDPDKASANPGTSAGYRTTSSMASAGAPRRPAGTSGH